MQYDQISKQILLTIDIVLELPNKIDRKKTQNVLPKIKQSDAETMLAAKRPKYFVRQVCLIQLY